MAKSDGTRFGAAAAGSAVLHAAAIGLFWFSASRATELPAMRIYAVNIVSPPPAAAGDPAPEVAAPEPEPEAPEPVAEPEPQPEPPPPPPPKPEPAPPKKAEPKPPPKKEPPPKPAPKQEEAPKRPAEQPKPTPARGANPQASSAGGEGLNVKVEGVQFTDPAYLENIIRQVNRYFRPPSGSRTDVVEVVFWINRDGSVSDIDLGRASASFAFRSAAMEAVEQAGLNRAFGPLPSSYPADRLPVAFEFRPAR